MSNLKAKITEYAKAILPEIIRVRRHLHKNPELSFEEYNTSKFISSWLTQHQIEHTTGWAKTGISGEIKGDLPGKHCIALRADIDALPINENSTAEYCSVNKGVMHACGHDVHTASLLGTLAILQQNKAHFGGSIRFVFQPGEELLPGGAKLMLKEGALGSPLPQAIFGQHVLPELEAGKVGFKAGMYMASADEVYINIHGKGGHAAMPENLADPIIASANVLLALQQIVSRNNSPKMPSVLSFGKVEANGATNVIPNTVHLAGTFRTFDEQWRQKAHQRINEIAENTAKAYACTAEVIIKKGYPSLINHEATSKRAMGFAKALLGAERVVDLSLRMTAEDFAWYAQQMPACFYRMGTGFAHTEPRKLHTAEFDVDEKALETSSALMAWLAIHELNYIQNENT